MLGDLPIGIPGVFGVICGPMKSGKTEQIIRLIQRLEFQKNLSYELYKPAADTRSEDLYSRDKRRVACKTFNESSELLAVSSDLVIIDEIHLADKEIVSVINELCRLQKHVLVLGLDLDRNTKVFGHMGSLLAHADYVKKISAFCDVCGKPSRYSEYLGKEDSQNQILLGDKEYRAVCRDCYKKK